MPITDAEIRRLCDLYWDNCLAAVEAWSESGFPVLERLYQREVETADAGREALTAALAIGNHALVALDDPARAAALEDAVRKMAIQTGSAERTFDFYRQLLDEFVVLPWVPKDDAESDLEWCAEELGRYLLAKITHHSADLAYTENDLRSIGLPLYEKALQAWPRAFAAFVREAEQAGRTDAEL